MKRPAWNLLSVGSLPLTILGLVILAVAAFVALAPGAPEKPDATWTRIEQERVLRIGIDPSFPPFEVDDGRGNLSGLDIALADRMASAWQVRIQYVYTGYDGLYDALIGHQFDLILSALPYNPSKTEDVSFSHSYFNGGPVLVVPTAVKQVQSLSDLTGQSVAVELGTNGDALARRWQRRLRLALREYSSTREALVAAQGGQAAGALVDPISFYDWQKQQPDSLRLAGKALADELYVIAVRKDSPTLLKRVNALIDQMKLDGSLEELQRTWF